MKILLKNYFYFRKCATIFSTIILNCQISLTVIQEKVQMRRITFLSHLLSIIINWVDYSYYNFFKLFLLITLRESLIPEIYLGDRNNATLYYYRQGEFMNFFNNKVNKTEKLVKRFEEFSASDSDNSLFCGVSYNFLFLLFYFIF